MLSRLTTLVVCSLTLAANLALGMSALHAAPKKDDLTAAMVYRLTKFVSWPESAFTDKTAEFSICFDSKNGV